MPSTATEALKERRRILTIGGAGTFSLLPGTPRLGASARRGEGDVQAIRSPSLPAPSGEKGLPAPPPVGVIALNRVAFGPRPGDLDAFQALGGNDDQRPGRRRHGGQHRLSASAERSLDPAHGQQPAGNRFSRIQPQGTLGDNEPLGIVSGTDFSPDYGQGHGALFLDGFESGNTSLWNSAVGGS